MKAFFVTDLAFSTENEVESAKVTGSVANLSKRLQTLENKLKNVDKLNADVAALIKLERDNYLEDC